MKVIYQSRYGSPESLELREIDKPAVADNEVLVRVHAASVHPDVWHVVRGFPYILRFMGSGLFKPKNPVPGTDFAGRVESVGQNVTRFQQGDEVFGESIKNFQWTNGGAYAEYAAVAEDNLAVKPPGVTFEEAASVPTSGYIAYMNLLHQGEVHPGQKVLVNGAAGGVGALALQFAKAYGAEVTGVDITGKLDLVLSLGADLVVDYTKEDFTQRGERYDLIFDVPGNHSLSKCRRALTPEGRYVLIGHDHFGASGGRWFGSLPRFIGLMVKSLFVKQLPKPDFSMPTKKETMAVMRDLLEAGKLTPIIDRTFPLNEVPEAIRFMESGQARGKIVITMGGG